MKIDHIIDATGLKCPLPVLKAQKEFRSLTKGTVVQIKATDPNAPRDFEDLCKLTSISFVSCDEEDGTYDMIIRL